MAQGFPASKGRDWFYYRRLEKTNRPVPFLFFSFLSYSSSFPFLFHFLFPSLSPRNTRLQTSPLKYMVLTPYHTSIGLN